MSQQAVDYDALAKQFGGSATVASTPPLRMSDRPQDWNDADEQRFTRWYADVAARFDLDPNPDDPQHFYNYRHAFKVGAWPDAAGHWPSEFKAAEHPNRFVAGVDTAAGSAIDYDALAAAHGGAGTTKDPADFSQLERLAAGLPVQGEPPPDDRYAILRLLDRIFTPIKPIADFWEQGAAGLEEIQRNTPVIPGAVSLAPFGGAPTPGLSRMMPTSAGDIALTVGGPASRIASAALAARGATQAAAGEGTAERGLGALQLLLGSLGVRMPRSAGVPATSTPASATANPSTLTSDLFNMLRGRAPAASAPGVPGGRLTRPAPASIEQQIADMLAELRAVDPPPSVSLPPAAVQPAVTYPRLRPRTAAATAADAVNLPLVSAPTDVEQTIELLRRTVARPPAVSRGFAEPPIAVNRPGPVAGDALPARVVEAVASRPAATVKPHYTAAQMVELLKAREAERATTTAVLRGRTAFEKTIPRGTPVPDEVLKDLDLKGVAYRDADRAYLDAQRAFTAKEIDAAALQAAQLGRRQAGKALTQAELRHRAMLTKPLPKDAGVIAPDVVRWIASTSTGAAAGAAYDEEQPLRGAILGGLLGASAPGTIAGVRSEGTRAVVKAYVSGLLSGPPTHIRNLTSTTLNGLFRYASHPAATGFDVLRSTITGTPREKFIDDILPGVVATLTGVRRGGADALKVIRTGVSPYAAVQGSGALKKYELPGGLSNPMNWPGRALQALDTLMARTLESQVLAEVAYAQARKSGLTGLAAWRAAGHLQASPTPALSAAATREANRVIFRNVGEGKMGQFVESIERLRDDHPMIGALAPFVRVPTAIVRSMIELTPAGLLLKDTLTVREKMERLGRMFTGSLLLYEGAHMVTEGRASGSGPTNPIERSKLMESSWRPHSVNLRLPDALGQKLGGSKSDDGTYWVPNAGLGPVGMLFSATADVVEGWRDAGEKDDSTKEDQLFAILGRFARFATDATFLSDSADLGEALNNPDLLKRWVGRKAQSAVPMSSLMRTVTRASDPIVRQPETTAEWIKEILPGQSESVPARLDRFGEEIKRATPTGAAAYIVPSVSPVKRDPLLELINRSGASVGKPTGRMTIGEFTPPLSREEERDLVRSRGQLNKAVLQLLAKHDTFHAYPPDVQKQIIERLRSQLAQQRRTGEIVNLLRNHPEWGPEIARQLQQQERR
jgi:hypothetical protein